MPDTTTRVAPTQIWLHRAEGPTDELGDVNLSAPNCWLAAWVQLRNWSHTAPRDGGYDKVDFRVTFADGYVYHGRYDLRHDSDCDLARHIRGFVTAHLDPALAAYLNIDPADFQAFLDTYDLIDPA